jgi:hypothetical protein
MMMLDDRMFSFTSAATIRQLLYVLLREIEERKEKLIADENTEVVVPVEFQRAFSTSCKQLVRP